MQGGYKGNLFRFDTDSGQYEPMNSFPGLGQPVDDFVMGPTGLAYARATGHLVRFDPMTWKEVPLDYGEPVEGAAGAGKAGAKGAAPPGRAAASAKTLKSRAEGGGVE